MKPSAHSIPQHKERKTSLSARPAGERLVWREKESHGFASRSSYASIHKDQAACHEPESHPGEPRGLSFQAVFENAGSAMLVLDSRGSIRFANRAFERLSGCSRQELESKKQVGDIIEVMHDPGFAWDHALDPTAQRHCQGVVVHCRAKQGSGSPAHLYLDRLPESGCWVVTLVDMSEVNRTEEQLRHKQRLLALGRVMEGIAHEFNNLLQGMSSALDLWSLRHRQLEPDEKRYLGYLDRNLQALKTLIANMRKAARPSAWRSRFVDLDAVVQRTTQHIAAALPQNIRLRTEINAAHCAVWADEQQIEQALCNVLNNAVEALLHVPEGRIRVRTEKRTVEAHHRQSDTYPGLRSGDYYVLSVSDNGVGIDAESLQRIFDPFFSQRTDNTGTGLGLSIVYSVVKGHKGYIYGHGRPGHGATFEIFLPRETGMLQGSCPTTSSAGALSPGPHKGRVLLVSSAWPFSGWGPKALSDRGYALLRTDHSDTLLDGCIQCAHEVDIAVVRTASLGLEAERFITAVRHIKPEMGLLLVTDDGRELRTEEDDPQRLRRIPSTASPAAVMESIEALLQRA